jgi:thiamine kinase-like enzyme
VSEPAPIDAHPFAAELAGQDSFELGFLLERLGGRRWPVVARHGDYAPWNILASRQGRLSALDWEYGSLAGLPGLDIAYYILRVAHFIYRWAPPRAAAYAVSHLEKRAGFRRSEAAALVRLAAWLAHRDSVEDAVAHDAPLRAWLRAVWQKEN